jgi:hypothetical protein
MRWCWKRLAVSFGCDELGVGENKDKSGISRVQSDTSRSNVRSYCVLVMRKQTPFTIVVASNWKCMRLWATGATTIGGHGQVENWEIWWNTVCRQLQADARTGYGSGTFANCCVSLIAEAEATGRWSTVEIAISRILSCGGRKSFVCNNDETEIL